MNNEIFTDILLKAVKLDEKIESLTEFGEGADKFWEIIYEEQPVTVKISLESELFHIRTPVPLTLDFVSSARYAEFLQHNVLWSETGGVTLGLDETGDILQVMVTGALPGLDPQRFYQSLGGLLSRANSWAEIIRSVSVNTGEDPFEKIEGMIKV